MKYLKIFENYQSDEEIHEICKKYSIDNYTIVDGRVNVDENVYLSHMKLTKLPLLFGVVTGYFYCSGNELTSLEGCPTSVGGNFDCSGNELTSLEGCPTSVGGNFDCSYNELISLKGCPKNITGAFNCQENYLTSLEGGPENVTLSFNCRSNKLASLEHCPKNVGGSFNFRCNNVIELVGIGKIGGYLDCYDNPVVELWRFIDTSKIELFNYFDPVRPPEKEGDLPIIYLTVFNSYLEQIGEDSVAEVKGYKCL